MLLTDQLGGQRVVKQARAAVHAGSAGGERENPHSTTAFNWRPRHIRPWCGQRETRARPLPAVMINWRSSRRPPNHVVYIGWSAEGAALCGRDWPIMVLTEESV